MDQEIRKGIKTFFMNADSSLTFDDGQLQVLFQGGFEVYPLPETRLIPIEAQVDSLMGLFNELIIFFNVDSQLPEGDWPSLLRRLSDRHGDQIRLGVFHHEFDAQRRARLEQFYLLEARVQAGCIYVGQGKRPDFPKLKLVLMANEANGRRKAIRMSCTGRLNFVVKEKRYEARVIEISVSHFLCVFKGGDPGFESSVRFRDVQLMVGGPVVNVDAVVMIKRLSGGDSSEVVYICGFVQKGKTDLGLDPPENKIVIGLIQTYCTQRITELIQDSYQQKWKSRIRSGAGEPGQPQLASAEYQI